MSFLSRPCLANLLRGLVIPAGLALGLSLPATGQAQVSPFRQAVAESVAGRADLAPSYRARGFAGIWTGADAAAIARRNALLSALSRAEAHGLPVSRYDPEALVAKLRAARSPEERAEMDVEMTRVFLRYARDVQTGLLEPGRVVELIRREVPLRDPAETLAGFLEADPAAFLRALAPGTLEYGRLMRARAELQRALDAGGWGPRVPETKIVAGDSGPAVVALRDRLIAMGDLAPTTSAEMDAALIAAVRAFQTRNGLAVDGVVGPGTRAELNRSAEERLQSVLVAMERERWTNMERGQRHVLVNLTDFSATIIDDGQETFRTRSVIGAEAPDRQTPEFSDVMEHMVINPSWYVPRSIVVGEYLPQLKRNRNAASQILITDRSGREVSRSSIDFSRYDERSFPYSMRQPPSNSNALGLVKFMFPNRYNIYLHDTPAKSLFGRESRAFSHGCVRLNDPFEFAYALLAAQEDDPEGFFQSRLATKREARVVLDAPVPVHLIYRTAFTDTEGRLQFRRDVYGRDRTIWDALAGAGVEISRPAS
ncbi:L,D-transpeptidase family protein [Limimaricola sp.]|uniref:L,D-transpeptidase family protein n=1 Tax=Limimaricola sp. TaxID=2211665 RepID=UPI0040586CA3